jgi:hypothetical protein
MSDINNELKESARYNYVRVPGNWFFCARVPWHCDEAACVVLHSVGPWPCCVGALFFNANYNIYEKLCLHISLNKLWFFVLLVSINQE